MCHNQNLNLKKKKNFLAPLSNNNDGIFMGAMHGNPKETNANAIGVVKVGVGVQNDTTLRVEKRVVGTGSYINCINGVHITLKETIRVEVEDLGFDIGD